MKNGIFITIEGGEACGKSTQVAKLRQYIIDKGLDDKFLFVREPGGTPLAEEIRKLLLDYEVDYPLPMTELLLFSAARSEIVNKKILPALNEGKIVFADRFYDSTIAYQGNARKIMSPEDILKLTKTIIGDIKPDLTFFLKIEPEIAFVRKKNMTQGLDRIEKESLTFHKDVQAGYEYISNLEKERFCVIDATKSPDEIFAEITKALTERFPEIFK
jgi:dTMP kinase